MTFPLEVRTCFLDYDSKRFGDLLTDYELLTPSYHDTTCLAVRVQFWETLGSFRRHLLHRIVILSQVQWNQQG